MKDWSAGYYLDEKASPRSIKFMGDFLMGSLLSNTDGCSLHDHIKSARFLEGKECRNCRTEAVIANIFNRLLQ